MNEISNEAIAVVDGLYRLWQELYIDESRFRPDMSLVELFESKPTTNCTSASNVVDSLEFAHLWDNDTLLSESPLDSSFKVFEPDQIVVVTLVDALSSCLYFIRHSLGPDLFKDFSPDKDQLLPEILEFYLTRVLCSVYAHHGVDQAKESIFKTGLDSIGSEFQCFHIEAEELQTWIQDSINRSKVVHYAFDQCTIIVESWWKWNLKQDVTRMALKNTQDIDYDIIRRGLNLFWAVEWLELPMLGDSADKSPIGEADTGPHLLQRHGD